MPYIDKSGLTIDKIVYYTFYAYLHESMEYRTALAILEVLHDDRVLRGADFRFLTDVLYKASVAFDRDRSTLDRYTGEIRKCIEELGKRRAESYKGRCNFRAIGHDLARRLEYETNGGRS